MRKFKVKPSQQVQRKIDFFITPYNRKINIDRAMRFDENPPATASKEEKHDLEKYDWAKFTDMLMNSSEETLKYLVRHRSLSSRATDDFLTKLDLIETHRDLFEDETKLQ